MYAGSITDGCVHGDQQIELFPTVAAGYIIPPHVAALIGGRVIFSRGESIQNCVSTAFG